jgi:UDP-N-acetylglucosamine 2-epimerase (non-hydrolysing)
MHIVGNRPQFIKLAPFLIASKRDNIGNTIVHSGQHYDYEMSKIFFESLEIRKPDYYLSVGSATHAVQTGKMLIAMDPILLKEKPDVVIVYGDTNTTLAGALAGYKLNIPVAHVEAGMREYIWRPEEINKKVADHCSTYCFCPISRAKDNLLLEGIPKKRIFLTGDITYDAFCMSKDIVNEKASINIPSGDYFLLTMHRAETIDYFEEVSSIIEALLNINHHIVYPIHPHTYKALENFKLIDKLKNAGNIKLIKPVGNFEFLKLLLNCNLVLTDSSGVIKEAFYARKPCVTLDYTTEYIEIFNLGYNILAGHATYKILESVKEMLNKKLVPIDETVNPFGDGKASNKMIDILFAGGDGDV